MRFALPGILRKFWSAIAGTSWLAKCTITLVRTGSPAYAVQSGFKKVMLSGTASRLLGVLSDEISSDRNAILLLGSRFVEERKAGSIVPIAERLSARRGCAARLMMVNRSKDPDA